WRGASSTTCGRRIRLAGRAFPVVPQPTRSRAGWRRPDMPPELVSFVTTGEARKAIEATGVEAEGARRLSEKAVLRPIRLTGIKGGAANLLKQEMLARGGDASVPSIAVMQPDQPVDTYLLGTVQDYRSLIRWLKATPLFGFPRLAEELMELL